MIQDAIKHVATQAIENATTKVLRVTGEPADTYYLDTPGKGIERHTCEPAPRAYTARTLTGLCEQINFFAGKDGVCVFVGRGSVVVSLKESDRREKITMPLDWSQPFRWLRDAKETGRSLNQKELVWLLRSTFRNDVTPMSFCTDIRQVKFAGSSDGESQVAVGSESLRKSVQASLALGSGNTLSEEISMHAAVYEGISERDTRCSFRVAVDVNLPEQKFFLKVMPGEIERAEISAVESIAEYIRVECPKATVFDDSTM